MTISKLIMSILATHQYVALGLSQTPFMGDTSVIECVRPPPANIIEAFTSWNFPQPQQPTRDGVVMLNLFINLWGFFKILIIFRIKTL